MRETLVVFRRELRSLFLSPIGYLFGAVVLAVLLAFVSFAALQQGARASAEPLFSWLAPAMIVFVPGLTMGVWAEERKLGTIELLLTFPLRIGELVLGKFLACVAYLAVVLLLTIGLPLTLGAYGKLDWTPVLGGYVASLLFCSSFVAVGMFWSSTTRDQLVALILSFSSLAVLYLLGFPVLIELVTEWLPAAMVDLANGVSPYKYFDSIGRGVFDTRDFLYFACFCGFFLYANVLALQARRTEGSAAATAQVLLHVGVLALVLAQVVFLASRQRVRFDLTSDQLNTSTSSTREVLARLDKRLVVEAYFSPKDKLPVAVRETRAWADAFLDELAQLGDGKVVVQRFDPNADKAVKDKATRVGVKPLELRTQSSTSLSVDVHWQGLRFVYGGDKSKVLPQFAPGSSFLAEAVVTPAIKEVLTTQKRRIGYMEWPATNPQGPQAGPLGWNLLRTFESIAKRYEFQNLKDEDGALLPDDLETLFLFRPKDLTDRQKYVLDQFVVKGGTLVAFVDAAEYMVGPQRAMTKVPLAIDAAGSTQKFTDQLLHYGLDWKPRLVADLSRDANQPRDPIQGRFEYFAVPQLTPFGQQLTPIEYPYFFHPLAVDWQDFADEFARGKDRKVDAALAEQYRKLFVPGMPSDEFVFQAWKQQKRGPGFYWPTWVGVRTKAGGAPDLPPDVQGRVLLWSSPATLVEDPPQALNPVGFGGGQQMGDAYQKFQAKLRERFDAEPRQQAPLMVEAKGRFSSFFAGQERPKRASELKEEAAKAAADAAKAGEPKADEAAKPDPAQGPPKPDAEAAEPTVVAEAAMVERGAEPGRIVLVGDADFLRDDIVRGDHAQAGGPVSGRAAGPFFAQLLDWLAEDKDLVALQSKVATDRTLQFVAPSRDPGADPRLQEQALRRKVSLLRAANFLLPIVLLAAIGLGVFLVRRAQKRSFLVSVG